MATAHLMVVGCLLSGLQGKPQKTTEQDEFHLIAAFLQASQRRRSLSHCWRWRNPLFLKIFQEPDVVITSYLFGAKFSLNNSHYTLMYSNLNHASFLLLLVDAQLIQSQKRKKKMIEKAIKKRNCE